MGKLAPVRSQLEDLHRRAALGDEAAKVSAEELSASLRSVVDSSLGDRVEGMISRRLAELGDSIQGSSQANSTEMAEGLMVLATSVSKALSDLGGRLDRLEKLANQPKEKPPEIDLSGLKRLEERMAELPTTFPEPTDVTELSVLLKALADKKDPDLTPLFDGLHQRLEKTKKWRLTPTYTAFGEIDQIIAEEV